METSRGKSESCTLHTTQQLDVQSSLRDKTSSNILSSNSINPIETIDDSHFLALLSFAWRMTADFDAG